MDLPGENIISLSFLMNYAQTPIFYCEFTERIKGLQLNSYNGFIELFIRVFT